MCDREPMTVMRDLSRKAANDACEAALRTIMLVDHKDDRLMIALGVLMGVLGTTVAIVEAARGVHRDAPITKPELRDIGIGLIKGIFATPDNRRNQQAPT